MIADQFSHFLACVVLYLVFAICVALPYKVQHWATFLTSWAHVTSCALKASVTVANFATADIRKVCTPDLNKLLNQFIITIKIQTLKL